MANLFKEYLPLTGGQELKITVSFSQGGYNWGTGQRVAKGYRVHVIPVKRSKDANFSIEESGAFTGFGDTLLPLEANQRQTKGRLAEAIAILNERKAMYCFRWIEQFVPENEQAELFKMYPRPKKLEVA